MPHFEMPHLQMAVFQMVVIVASGHRYAGVKRPKHCNEKRLLEPRLYIDRLAHWRCSLVDLNLKFELLLRFPRPVCPISQLYIKRITQSFNLGWMKKKQSYLNGIRTLDHRIKRPRSYHWATTYLHPNSWYRLDKSYENKAKIWGTARNIPDTAIYSPYVG